ncbi:MAG: HK97 family phage prohead protease [Bacillota bacterium]|nr:HK97 family phage prohead protease [Bacillota bacterium]
MKNEDKKSPLLAQTKRRVNFGNENAKFRATTEEVDGQQVRVLKGYPILFGVYGKPYRGSKWVERIDKAAVATVDFSKLMLLWNHDQGSPLAKASKNMEVTVDDVGVFIKATLGNTELDNLVYDRVSREIIDGMSFWFDSNAMIAHDWENKIDVVTKINEIYEVSIVTFPAYEETVVITADGTDPTPNPPDDEKLPPSTNEDDDDEEDNNSEEVKQALLSLIETL